MSVILMGMEMPKSCRECCMEAEGYFCMPIEVQNKDNDVWLRTQYWGDIGERPDWCPLRPLPEKHGRLIDENELREAFSMGKDCALCHQDIRDCQYNKIFTRMEFCGGIDDMKTIIVAEGD